MSLGVLQDCNCVARGWVRRSVFVFFSYAFTAATKMARKFELDVDVEGGWDMVTTQSRESQSDRSRRDKKPIIGV